MSNNPFQSPIANRPPKQPTITAPSQQYQFKPIRGLSICLVVCALAISVLGMTISISEVVLESIWPGFNDPNLEFPTETAAFVAMLMAAVAVLGLIPSLAVVALGPMFSYRSNANARSLGADHLEYTPGWNAGFWFIPIVNLFRPFQATSEVFHASEDFRHMQSSAMSPFLGLWWTFYLVGNGISNVESRLALRGIYSADWFHLLSFASSSFVLIGGILYIRIVLRIAESQTAAAKYKID